MSDGTATSNPSNMQNIAAIAKMLGLVSPLLFPQTQKQGFGPGPTMTRAGSIAGALPALFSGTGDIAEQFAKLQSEKDQPTMAQAFESTLKAKRPAPVQARKGEEGFAVNIPESSPTAPEWMKKIPFKPGEDLSSFMPPTIPGKPEITEASIPGGGTIPMRRDKEGNWVPVPRSDIEGLIKPETEFEKQKHPLELDKLRAEIKKDLATANKEQGALTLNKNMTKLLNDYTSGKELNPRQKSALAGWWSKNMDTDPPEDLLGDKPIPEDKKIGILQKIKDFFSGGSKSTSPLATGGGATGPKKVPSATGDEGAGGVPDWIQQEDGTWIPNPALK